MLWGYESETPRRYTVSSALWGDPGGIHFSQCRKLNQVGFRAKFSHRSRREDWGGSEALPRIHPLPERTGPDLTYPSKANHRWTPYEAINPGGSAGGSAAVSTDLTTPHSRPNGAEQVGIYDTEPSEGAGGFSPSVPCGNRVVDAAPALGSFTPTAGRCG